MTGGMLDANWDEGPIRARFKIQADFLVDWAPFRYELNDGVTFAVDARLAGPTHTLSINVGAELHLWGPEFSGRAHIDLGVMGFTIAFGSEEPPRDPLGGRSSSERLLGTPETMLRVQVRNGLLAEIAEGKYVVDPERFEAATDRVPATRVVLNGEGGSRGADSASRRWARAGRESAHRIRVEAGRRHSACL